MIFDREIRQINRRIKKKELVRYMCSFLRFCLYLPTISIRVISYRISSSGSFYATLAYPDNKRRQRGRERERKERETIYLSCSSFFFFISRIIHSWSFFFALFLPSVVVNKILSGSDKRQRTRRDSTSHRLFWLVCKDLYKS
jgi:hypothetical protein